MARKRSLDTNGSRVAGMTAPRWKDLKIAVRLRVAIAGGLLVVAGLLLIAGQFFYYLKYDVWLNITNFELINITNWRPYDTTYLGFNEIILRLLDKSLSYSLIVLGIGVAWIALVPGSRL